jgi:hypothetical protein
MWHGHLEDLAAFFGAFFASSFFFLGAPAASAILRRFFGRLGRRPVTLLLGPKPSAFITAWLRAMFWRRSSSWSDGPWEPSPPRDAPVGALAAAAAAFSASSSLPVSSSLSLSSLSSSSLLLSSSSLWSLWWLFWRPLALRLPFWAALRLPSAVAAVGSSERSLGAARRVGNCPSDVALAFRSSSSCKGTSPA